MGNTASLLGNIQTNMFQATNLLFFAPLVLCLPPQEYSTPAPTQQYNPDIGQTNVGGYGVNKDPYCHMSRRWCSRTSASLMLREHATLKIRNLVLPSLSITALELLKPISSECASMSTSWYAI